MYRTFIMFILFSKSLAQIDGEFWWLNSKFNKFSGPPPQPKFEDLSEFETDQSAKIVFRVDGLHPKEEKLDLKVDREKISDEVGKSDKVVKFQDKSEIAWLDYTKEAMTVTPNPTQRKGNSGNKSPISDEFDIKFPDDNFISRDKGENKTNKVESVPVKSNNTNDYINTGKITYLTNVVPLKVNTNVAPESESICTFMKKIDCNRIGGIIYVKHKSDWKHEPFETRLICCILPLRPELQSSKIYFLETPKPSCKRCKRSEKESTALKQRNALIFRKFGSQAHNFKLTTPSPTKSSHRIVTPSDEYLDPYWNIKNNKNPNRQGSQFKQTTKVEYDEDYIEDYVFEIPKPGGLGGLYSDHGPAKPGWTFPMTRPTYGVVDSDEVDDSPAFGYGSPTVDPRIEDRRSTNRPRVIGRPVKLSTYADKHNYDAESQTITYQSDPDFKVLQGFKLLNLVQNKSKIHRNSKKTTTERIIDSDSKEHVLTASLESNYDDGELDTAQVYKDCGQSARRSNRNLDGKDVGETERGSHPSLALVVLTKRKQSFLCYGTIVHPRAVVTIADCVHGRSDPGEITVIAGAWRLDDESREEWQKRMATIHLHAQYSPGNLAKNLALLYWKRPLRLTANVQPACLSDPHVGDSCKFYGWGGYDQAIRKQSRWQRALVLAPRTCEERVTSKRLPTEAFCASVHTRGSVTGIGGPLICTVGGRQSAVGVAVWRDRAVVLLPAREWITHAIDDLQLD